MRAYSFFISHTIFGFMTVMMGVTGCSTEETHDENHDTHETHETEVNDDVDEVFSCADFESPVPSETREQMDIPPTDLRNYRYCEVLPAFSYGDRICVEVYNTISFSDCPQEDWAELNAETLQEELDAIHVFLNGPRHWVINGAEGNADPTSAKISSFGNLQMSRPGLLDLENLNEMPSTGVQYVEHEVNRSNTWIYFAGNEVYELTSEEGERYIMQSYSRIIDADLEIEGLSSLGERLELPEGWTFSTRILDEDYYLVSDGKAFVIQDDLANTYQRH